MIDTPQIVDTTEQESAVIHLVIPRSEIANVMGPAMQEVIAAVQSQGIGPAGPIYSYHFTITPDTFDFEVGVPISAPVTATGRVKSGKIPATKVARTMYHGGYEGLGDAWGQLDAWITANGHEGRAGIWERYVAGPESSANPDDWQTELNHTIAS